MRHGELATTSRQGKVPIFKPTAPSFLHYKIFLYKLFPIENRPNFWFWAGQGLKLWRNTCFCWFKSSLALNFHVYTKTWKVGSLENVNFNLLSFKRCPYDDSWPISLGDLNIILGAWNGFSGKCRESCDRLFFLN